MPNRTIGVSLTGPWGIDTTGVPISCSIKFPSGYPNIATAKVSLEKTTSMTDESLRKVSSELQILGHTYMAWKRSSLEAILRYLLGERDLEHSLLWSKVHQEAAAKDADVLSSDSSSDGEDEADGFSAGRNHGLESSEGNLPISNAQYNVPLPKACGAFWTEDGRLVCFFPPKKEASSLLELSLRANNNSGGSQDSTFAGFGRLYKGVTRYREATVSSRAIESDESDSDDSSSSSSGSSSTSSTFAAPYHQYFPSIAWRNEAFDVHRDLSVDESQISGGLFDRHRSSTSAAPNHVSIHNLSDLLPAKQRLAEQYVFEGDKYQCCQINAVAAERHGELDLADLWTLIGLILRNEVPMDIKHHPSQDQYILVLAQRAASSLKKKDSAIDLSLDGKDEGLSPNIKSVIQWGGHPFGRRWLVNSL